MTTTHTFIRCDHPKCEAGLIPVAQRRRYVRTASGDYCYYCARRRGRGRRKHLNCPDVLKRGWCFDVDEDGHVDRVCRTRDARNPLRCWCGNLAISRDHMHPWFSDYTLCRKHWNTRQAA